MLTLGKAPYGFKKVSLYRGIDKKGRPIYKTIWNINEETAPILRKIVVELYTKQEMSYTKIRDYLNINNIKNSNDGIWSTSTIVSMLREDRLEEYAGIAIWNKENKNVIGKKYNSRDEWVICDNAHPAIITKEELQQALERKNKTSNNNYKFKPDSDYLLSGLNVEGEFLFTCSECGGHVIGYKANGSHIRKYICSTFNHKGNCACLNNWKIDKEWIENKVISIIQTNYFKNKKLESTIDNLYKELLNINTVYTEEIKNIENKIKTLETQIQNLLNSIKCGINPELIVAEISKIERDKNNLEIKKSNLLNNINEQPKISRKDIEEYFYNFQKLFTSSNINEKKELIKTFINKIVLNKKEHLIEIIPYFIGVRSIGAGRGNRTLVISLEG